MAYTGDEAARAVARCLDWEPAGDTLDVLLCTPAVAAEDAPLLRQVQPYPHPNLAHSESPLLISGGTRLLTALRSPAPQGNDIGEVCALAIAAKVGLGRTGRAQ